MPGQWLTGKGRQPNFFLIRLRAEPVPDPRPGSCASAGVDMLYNKTSHHQQNQLA
jgi:hypothetical protein